MKNIFVVLQVLGTATVKGYVEAKSIEEAGSLLGVKLGKQYPDGSVRLENIPPKWRMPIYHHYLIREIPRLA